MSKLKSLLIALVVVSFVSIGMTFDNPIIPTSPLADGPIIFPNGDGTSDGPIIFPNGDENSDAKSDIQLVDGPIIFPNGDGTSDGPIIFPNGDENSDAKSDIQLVDGPIIFPNGDGIIFPNPIPPTTGNAVVTIA